MLGIVFTEFMDMVEDRFSPDLLDEVIESAELESEAAYTAVGYYDYQEMIRLVTVLHQKTQIPVDDLIQTFGCHLFGVLIGKYPALGEGISGVLDFLEIVDSTIHKEVLKLYPNAELPTFETNRVSPDHLQMIYQSKRPFSQLALGLMHGCAEHFGQKLDVQHQSTQQDELFRTVFDIHIQYE